MKNKKVDIPYIITIVGTFKGETNKLDDIKEELFDTNVQYLISNANSIFVEFDEDEFNRVKKEMEEKKVV